VNHSPEKSAILAPPVWTSPEIYGELQSMGMAVVRHTDESFPLLGANMTRNSTKFAQKQLERVRRFFNVLNTTLVHPAILMTILRLCGNPKLLHYCSVMPPEWTLPVAIAFDRYARELLSQPFMMNTTFDRFNSELLYERAGAGLTCYETVAARIYEEARIRFSECRGVTESGTPVPRLKPTELVRNNPLLTVPVRCQMGSGAGDFLFYTGDSAYMTPAEYITALAIRLRVDVEKLAVPVVCNCNATCVVFSEFIDHVFKCDQSTRFTHLARHDLVKLAIVAVCKSYDIHCTVEPDFYVYDSGEMKRPDITFHVTPKVATDVTIVFPGLEVDVAASEAAKRKSQHHEAAVTRMSHVFIPFAMEVYGHMHEACFTLIDRLSMQLLPMYRNTFRKDVVRAVSVALAKGRAAAYISAVAQQRSARRKS
jgi:hypothetical protein